VATGPSKLSNELAGKKHRQLIFLNYCWPYKRQWRYLWVYDFA